MDFKKEIRKAVIEEIKKNKDVTHSLSAGFLEDMYDECSDDNIHDNYEGGIFKLSKKYKKIDLKGMNPDERAAMIIEKILGKYEGGGDYVLGSYKQAFKYMRRLYDDTISAKKNSRILNAVFSLFKNKKNDEFTDYKSVLDLLEYGSVKFAENMYEQGYSKKYGKDISEFKKKRKINIDKIEKKKTDLKERMKVKSDIISEKPKIKLFEIKKYDSPLAAVKNSISLSKEIYPNLDKKVIKDEAYKKFFKAKKNENGEFVFKKMYQRRFELGNSKSD